MKSLKRANLIMTWIMPAVLIAIVGRSMVANSPTALESVACLSKEAPTYGGSPLTRSCYGLHDHSKHHEEMHDDDLCVRTIFSMMIDEIRMAVVLCRVCGSNVWWSRA